MPTFKIASSLYEPVTNELEDGRKFISAPLSPFLIQEVTKIQEQLKAGTLEGQAAIIQQISIIYGLDLKEAEKIDIRILEAMIENAAKAIRSNRPGQPTTPEIEAEKNAPKPEAETTQ